MRILIATSILGLFKGGEWAFAGTSKSSTASELPKRDLLQNVALLKYPRTKDYLLY
jgi:hypothetical protein